MARMSYDAIYGFRRRARQARGEARRRPCQECRDTDSVELGLSQGAWAISRRLTDRRGTGVKLLSALVALSWLVLLGTDLGGDAADIREHAQASDYFQELHERRLQSTTLCEGEDCDISSCLTREQYDDVIRASGFWLSGSVGLRTTLGCASQTTTEYADICKGSGGDPLLKDHCREVCLKKKWAGVVVFYFVGIFYMFLALAIVCDEFFVPSLEVIAEELQLSNDVAGATLMAAGGSMPELFTSFLATFRESDVGFVAIVGSAVFNVLFVIGVCGLFSEETLTLTWFPLFRDCFCYVIALSTIALFFQISSPGEVEWWEALILLGEYCLYCIMMAFNPVLEAFIMPKVSKVVPSNDDEGTEVSDKDQMETRFDRPSTFRAGVIQLLTQSAHISDTAGIAAVTQIKGNLMETFTQLDKDQDGFLSEEEIVGMVKGFGLVEEDQLAEELKKATVRNAEGKLSFEVFQKWYLASEARVGVEVKRVFDKFDKDHNGRIDRDEIKQMLKSLGHHPSEDQVDEAIADIRRAHTEYAEDGACANTTASATLEETSESVVNFDQFYAWYNKSLFWENQRKKHQVEEDMDDGGFSLDWPEGDDGEKPSTQQIIWYIITYPLASLLWCTLPDVRREGCDTIQIAIFEFIGSLLWIAAFATCLYEWLSIASNTIGVPVNYAAVTLLAAGTSVPDLLSSYVVAKQGYGDMAVSSSIGSNIFDVTVGLPLPWFLYCISGKASGRSVLVGGSGDSTAFTQALLVLILMLVAVIGTIGANGWRMNKSMGTAMMFLYVVYIVYFILDAEGFLKV